MAEDTEGASEAYAVTGGRPYGSSIQGDDGQDYDVLAITDRAEPVDRRYELERALREATGLRVDLNVATPRGLRLLLDDADSLGLHGGEHAEWLRAVAKQVAVLEQILAGRTGHEAYVRRVREPAEEAVLRQAVTQLEGEVREYPANEADDALTEESERRLTAALARPASRRMTASSKRS